MACAQRIIKDWSNPVIVAASGPSLTKDVAWTARKARWFGDHRIVAVSDAYKLFPCADILYSCDSEWWNIHDGVPDFRGEKWSSHDDVKGTSNDKRACADKYGLKLVLGKNAPGFSTDQNMLHYGQNSGFQAVNLALLKGATKVVLIGFDMREVGGQRHFFGNHPAGLRNNGDYRNFIRAFEQAKPPVPIINATPGSALKCYPMMDLREALAGELPPPGEYPTIGRAPVSV